MNKPIPENEGILLEIIELADKPQLTIEDEDSIKIYIDKFYFYTDSAMFEECETEDQSVNLNIIHNVQYDIKGIDMDGDTPIFRVFTLENQNGIRYFTALGSDYIVGRVEEHTKENFVKLLTEQPYLKNNHLVKYLNNLILCSELEGNLSICNTEKENTKPKI